MDTIFLGNDDQKNLVGSKLTKFCFLCSYEIYIWLMFGEVRSVLTI